MTATLNITSAELKAAAQYQDRICSAINILGFSNPLDVTALESVKLALGCEVVKTNGPIQTRLNMSGLDVRFDLSSELIADYLDLVGDTVLALVPSVAAFIAALKSTLPQLEKNMEMFLEKHQAELIGH